VADVNAVARPSDQNLDPRGFVDVGGVAYFQATDPQRGAELWKSDGTEAGTVRVRDINPGPYGYFGPIHLTAVGRAAVLHGR
jgi:ELWxxDGT repeat protein